MMAALRVIVLYGGKSGEHEISLRSAASVLKNLDKNKYEIIPIGVDKQGCFFINETETLLANDSLPVKTATSQELPSLLENGKIAIPADVVFPVMHGPLYEDGGIQGLFKLANIAYVGCDILASAIGMDKDIARQLVSQAVSFAQYRTLSWHSTPGERALFCEQVATELGWPLFVKPCSLGSSVGIYKVKTPADLTNAVEDALRYDETILVEEYIHGREIELAVLENNNPAHAPLVSLPGEIRVKHADGFYSYSAKYLESGLTELIAPAILDKALIQTLQETAAVIFKRLKCKGLARVDFFVNDETGKICFNEINTLPGFTSISMYPRLWECTGIPYATLLDRLIASALTHHRCRQHIVTDYQ